MSVMKKEITLSLNDSEQVSAVCKALSSETRIEILKKLTERALSISEIAEAFYLPMSSACMHTKILEDAGLITLLPKPGLRGTQKLCGIKTSYVLVDLFAHKEGVIAKPSFTESMPLGNYVECDVTAPCGIASDVSYLANEDTPYGFYSSQRNQASLIWFTNGFLEYKFSNKSLKDGPVSQIEFSFEVCAEAPGYNNDWPSDIAVELNSRRVAAFLVKGDYGDRRGALNPTWWSDSLTQYGELKRLFVTSQGCFLDEKKVSEETIESLGLMDGYFFRFRLGVDRDAVHAGGLNLFGKKFGDYAQDINMKVTYM